LTDIDVETMTGICAVCGWTEVFKRVINKKSMYLCATKERADGRKHWRKHHSSPRKLKLYSAVRAQQEQDQQQTIDKHKLERGCKRCGYNADPRELELHFSDANEAELISSTLVHFRRKRLLHALKISDVYCVKCHPLIHSPTVTQNNPPQVMVLGEGMNGVNVLYVEEYHS
jgi:hypothetical protein